MSISDIQRLEKIRQINDGLKLSQFALPKLAKA